MFPYFEPFARSTVLQQKLAYLFLSPKLAGDSKATSKLNPQCLSKENRALVISAIQLTTDICPIVAQNYIGEQKIRMLI